MGGARGRRLGARGRCWRAVGGQRFPAGHVATEHPAQLLPQGAGGGAATGSDTGSGRRGDAAPGCTGAGAGAGGGWPPGRRRRPPEPRGREGAAERGGRGVSGGEVGWGARRGWEGAGGAAGARPAWGQRRGCRRCWLGGVGAGSWGEEVGATSGKRKKRPKSAKEESGVRRRLNAAVVMGREVQVTPLRSFPSPPGAQKQRAAAFIRAVPNAH